MSLSLENDSIVKGKGQDDKFDADFDDEAAFL